jgi:two-component system sensor histidine kinase KdpD
MRGVRRLRLDPRSFGWTAVIMAATALAAFVARPARGEVSGALIFVVGITLAGATMGLGAALVAAMASFLLYNFYFAEPVLTFRFDTASDLAPLVIFNLSAIMSGILAGRLRDQAEATAAANGSLTALLQISQSLQSVVRFEDIERTLAGPAATAAGVRLLPVTATDTLTGSDEQEGLLAPNVSLTALPYAANEPAAYDLRCGNRRIALSVTQGSPSEATGATLGSALANLVALAMERAALSEKIAEAETTARVESLESALLSSVSHDLRTPLATISASASSLIEYGDLLERSVADALLRSIVEESERLNRFTANLLQMTRLEAGQPLSTAQMMSVSDIMSVAVRRLRPRAGRRVIERLANEDCLVLVDAALFELVLLNVLENAILYSPDGSRISIALTRDDAMAIIEIADEGRGIPKADLTRAFERFYRVDAAEQMPRGSGLGLAIAKGFVQACGGEISAEVPGLNNRGTRIRIRLPLASERRD